MNESGKFLEWFIEQTPDLGEPSISWKEECYRIVYGGYNPLSIAGSLAAGGRFNIGGAQVSHLFPNFSMQGCLYAGSSLTCARKEAGDPLGKAQEYALKPKKTFHLWDLRLLIAEKLHYPDLKFFVDSTPLSAEWRLQKIPKISQMLAFFLRKKGGDGLIYPSTKDPQGAVLAFFIKDDPAVKASFDAIRQWPRD